MSRNQSIMPRHINQVLDRPGITEKLRNCPSGVSRVIPTEKELQDPSTAKVLLLVIRDGYAKEPERRPFSSPLKEDSQVMRIYKKGYLQSDLNENNGTIYVVPTRFHFLCVFRSV